MQPLACSYKYTAIKLYNSNSGPSLSSAANLLCELNNNNSNSNKQTNKKSHKFKWGSQFEIGFLIRPTKSGEQSNLLLLVIHVPY